MEQHKHLWGNPEPLTLLPELASCFHVNLLPSRRGRRPGPCQLDAPGPLPSKAIGTNLHELAKNGKEKLWFHVAPLAMEKKMETTIV